MLLNEKRLQPEDKIGRLEVVHKKKLVTKLKMIMVKDIINTIHIVSIDNPLIKTDYDVDGTISIKSNVDGQEGLYPILNVTMELVERGDNYFPRMKIEHLYYTELEPLEYTLEDITVDHLYESIFNKSYAASAFTTLILGLTQSERIDILDEITNIMDLLQQDYKFKGYTSIRRGRSLI